MWQSRAEGDLATLSGEGLRRENVFADVAGLGSHVQRHASDGEANQLL